MNPRKTFKFSLFHRVDVSKAADLLAHLLECDSWYVACHREHQFVAHLAKGGADEYAISFECTAPGDKGVYHGSSTSELAVVSLGAEVDLTSAKVEQIRSALAQLAQAAALHC
jgi:hypothetical protein